MAINHSTCSHERTPKARAACRARQRQHDASTTSLAETPLVIEVTEPCPVTLAGDACTRTAHSSIVKHLTASGMEFTTKQAARAARMIQSSRDKAAARIERRSRRTDPAIRVADRRMSEIRAAADQPTWDGARQAARAVARKVIGDPIRDCVQAELHRGGGKCACGWSA